MKRAILILLDSLYTLALALWFGLLAALLVAVHCGMPGSSLGLFVHRSALVAEPAALTVVAAQFLLRRRYERIRRLAVADGVRQLLTFGALVLAEFGQYSLFRPGFITAARIATLSWLAAAQLAILAVVISMTSWLLLQLEHGRAPAAPLDRSNTRIVSPSIPDAQAKPMGQTPRRKRK